jgi:hypothetical protein
VTSKERVWDAEWVAARDVSYRPVMDAVLEPPPMSHPTVRKCVAMIETG